MRKVGKEHNDPNLIMAGNWQPHHTRQPQLRTRYEAAIKAAIREASAKRDRATIQAEDGAEAYAYRTTRHRLGPERGRERRQYPSRRSPA